MIKCSFCESVRWEYIKTDKETGKNICGKCYEKKYAQEIKAQKERQIEFVKSQIEKGKFSHDVQNVKPKKRQEALMDSLQGDPIIVRFISNKKADVINTRTDNILGDIETSIAETFFSIYSKNYKLIGEIKNIKHWTPRNNPLSDGLYFCQIKITGLGTDETIFVNEDESDEEDDEDNDGETLF